MPSHCAGESSRNAASASLVALAAAAGATVVSAAPASAAGVTTVKAVETDFHIALSKTTYSPGTYTFTAVDKGKLQHNLVIDGPGVSDQKTPGLIAPGQSGSVTVTLKAGTYDIFCGVPGHKAEGMDVHIKVS